jgi:hypothetical protein
MIGRTFTLKIKKRKKDAEEPTKYMGCGDCDNLSRSITVPAATDDIEVLQRISKKLFGSFCLGKCVSAALKRWFCSCDLLSIYRVLPHMQDAA